MSDTLYITLVAVFALLFLGVAVALGESTPTPDCPDCVMLLDYRSEDLPSVVRIRTASECVDVHVGQTIWMEEAE